MGRNEENALLRSTTYGGMTMESTVKEFPTVKEFSYTNVVDVAHSDDKEPLIMKSVIMKGL